MSEIARFEAHESVFESDILAAARRHKKSFRSIIKNVISDNATKAFGEELGIGQDIADRTMHWWHCGDGKIGVRCEFCLSVTCVVNVSFGQALGARRRLYFLLVTWAQKGMGCTPYYYMCIVTKNSWHASEGTLTPSDLYTQPKILPGLCNCISSMRANLAHCSTRYSSILSGSKMGL